MKRKIVASLAILAVLNACSPVNFGSKRTNSASSVDMSDYFAARLAVGKQQLAQNRPTKAIEAFRQASYDERQAADAYNGMAVAYTMLGRDDVAHRLFERAIEANPMDQRYVRNLARLNSKASLPSDNSEQFARQELPVEISTEMASSFQQMPQNSRGVFTSDGELKPVANEVHIQTKSQGTTPRTVVGAVRQKAIEERTAVSAFDAAFAHFLNFPKPKASKESHAMARSAQAAVNRPSYLVKVELPAIKTAAAFAKSAEPKTTGKDNLPIKLSAATDKQQTYPLRFELPPVKEAELPSKTSAPSKKLAKAAVSARPLSRWIPTGGVSF